MFVNIGEPDRVPTDPLGIEMLAAHVAVAYRAWSVSILDMTTFASVERAFATLARQSDVDIIGLSSMWPNIAFISECANRIRRMFPRAQIVLGGSSVRALGPNLLRSIDALDLAVAGEGERAMIMILDEVPFSLIPNLYYRDPTNRVSFTFPEQLHLNIGLPPDRTWLERGSMRSDYSYVALNMEASRGCQFGVCSFCHLTVEASVHARDAPERYQKYRIAPEEAVWSDYATVVALAPRKINFVDEEFFGGRGDPLSSAGASLLRRIATADLGVHIPKNLYARAPDITPDSVSLLSQAGVTSVFLGIEAGSREDLKLFAKGASPEQNSNAVSLLVQAGIRLKAGFIMLHPLSTPAGLLANIAFLRSTGTIATIKHPLNRLDLLPGSTFHRRLLKAHPELLTTLDDQTGNIGWSPMHPVLAKYWPLISEVSYSVAAQTEDIMVASTGGADDGAMDAAGLRRRVALNEAVLDWLTLIAHEGSDGTDRRAEVAAAARYLIQFR
jgi:radical SAM superfamily enzyme YgiQ (UPF0313 family)